MSIQSVLNFRAELSLVLSLEQAYKPPQNPIETMQRVKEIVGVLFQKHALEIEYEDMFDEYLKEIA